MVWCAGFHGDELYARAGSQPFNFCLHPRE